jgi:DNA-binding transcriptional ArsR family regulator
MPKRNGQGIELLADPTRRAIIALLALQVGLTSMGLQPSKIAKEISRSRPATSRQLRLLHKAGLVSARKHFVDGRRVVYFIEPRRLGQITAWLVGTELARAFPPTPREEVGDPSDDVV